METKLRMGKGEGGGGKDILCFTGGIGEAVVVDECCCMTPLFKKIIIISSIVSFNLYNLPIIAANQNEGSPKFRIRNPLSAIAHGYSKSNRRSQV